MMVTSITTRRAFVGGAAASVAALAPTILSTGRHVGDAKAASAVTDDARAAQGPAASAEIAAWTAALGRRFRLSADGGAVAATLTHVVASAADRTRSAPGGRRPFRLRFAPVAVPRFDGDAIYALDRPVAGMAALFMTRGLDEAGRPVLTALVG